MWGSPISVSKVCHRRSGGTPKRPASQARPARPGRTPRRAGAERLTWQPIDEPPPSLDDTHAFTAEHGFFRARKAERRDPLAGYEVPPGPPFTPDEARREVRRFLDVLADGRPIAEDHDDPLEHAQRNGLLLLIGPDEERVLARIGRRMPRDMALAWREALRGGTASDAFGPLSASERLDEKRVEAELRSGDSSRRRNLWIGSAALVVVVALLAAVLLLRDDGDETSGAISFGEVETPTDGVDLRAGPPPAVAPALVGRLDRPVAVRAGEGAIEDRVVLDPPAEDLPQAPGAIAATLFRYNGSGQVVLVGPAGWLASACIQISPIAQSLRPFETAYHETAPGACPDWVYGRDAVVGCASDTTIMLDLQIPEGEVGLAEGGTASLSAVRVLLLGTAPAYEQISLNGQVTVAAGDEVTVPTFGGAVGESVSFDVSAAGGAPLVGTCEIR
jgi:hypothetical protein